MDWLKSILQSLPLDTISDILGEIVIWWSQMVKGVPPDDLPMYSYVGGSIIVLALWTLVARIMPKPLGGMTWIMIFAILLTPGSALGDPSMLAPASISVVYALMMKDTALAIDSAIPILVVLVVGMFIGFIWQLIRGAFESSLATARIRSSEDAKSTMNLWLGNYLARYNHSKDTGLLSKFPITRTKTAVSSATESASIKSHDKKAELNAKQESQAAELKKEQMNVEMAKKDLAETADIKKPLSKSDSVEITKK